MGPGAVLGEALETGFGCPPTPPPALRPCRGGTSSAVAPGGTAGVVSTAVGETGASEVAAGTVISPAKWGERRRAPATSNGESDRRHAHDRHNPRKCEKRPATG